MNLQVLLLSIVIVGLAFVALAIRIILKPKGKFPNTSVGGNPNMRKLGLFCAKCEEQNKHRAMLKKNTPINPKELKVIFD